MKGGHNEVWCERKTVLEKKGLHRKWDGRYVRIGSCRSMTSSRFEVGKTRKTKAPKGMGKEELKRLNRKAEKMSLHWLNLHSFQRHTRKQRGAVIRGTSTDH